jgi:hypothetical protein
MPVIVMAVVGLGFGWFVLRSNRKPVPELALMD